MDESFEVLGLVLARWGDGSILITGWGFVFFLLFGGGFTAGVRS